MTSAQNELIAKLRLECSPGLPTGQAGTASLDFARDKFCAPTVTRRWRGSWLAAVAAVALALVAVAAPGANAQGLRKDDIVFGPSGHPVAGATVRVCQPTATGTPCTPLATLYTDATLAVPATNPLQTDGIGNYHFYAPAGRYQIQISGSELRGR